VRSTYRTGVPLPSRCCILYIFFPTNISTEYFKHAARFPFFSSKCRLFHNGTFFGSCIIHILHTGCAKNLNVKLRCQKVKVAIFGNHFLIKALSIKIDVGAQYDITLVRKFLQVLAELAWLANNFIAAIPMCFH